MTAAALPHRYNPRRLKSKAAAISNVVADLNGLGSKESRTCPSHVRSRPATRLPPAGPFARQWLFTCSRAHPRCRRTSRQPCRCRNSRREGVLRSGIVEIHETPVTVSLEAVGAFTRIQIPSHDTVVFVNSRQPGCKYRFRMHNGSEGRTLQHEPLGDGRSRLT